MTKDNGGNAFPALCHDDTPGMTLRDWFAGKVIAGLVVRFDVMSPDSLTEAAYRIADSMLKERAK